jgi:predicted small lipoprotein YifL
MTRSMLISTLATAFALAACGKVGVLERPAPLYGAKAKADYNASGQAAADRAQERKDQDQIERLPREKRYDPNADPSSSRLVPVTGEPPAPNAPSPPGVLPDPLNQPPR